MVAAVGAVPWGTFVVNVTGAGALGYLVAVFAGRGRSAGAALFGTGVLGAYTTFSALAVELLAIGEVGPGAAVVHGLLSLGVGLVAAVAGTSAGARHHRHSAAA